MNDPPSSLVEEEPKYIHVHEDCVAPETKCRRQ